MKWIVSLFNADWSAFIFVPSQTHDFVNRLRIKEHSFLYLLMSIISNSENLQWWVFDHMTYVSNRKIDFDGWMLLRVSLMELINFLNLKFENIHCDWRACKILERVMSVSCMFKSMSACLVWHFSNSFTQHEVSISPI